VVNFAASRLASQYIQLLYSLGAFLTAMTAHSIHVEFYMTKISFLPGFFSVCVSALEQHSTDFVLCWCEREKKRLACL